jgi:hypothetical protein
MTDDRPNISSPGLDDRARKRRREAQRARLRRQRLWAIPVAAIVLVVVVVLASAGGGASKSHDPSTHRASTAVGRGSPAIVSGGPLAPVAVGGRAALWAPKTVVYSQPGTAAA